VDRHITVTGFVVHEAAVALHWHRKLAMWLPAGGHIEANEDPVQAVLREVREEFGVEASVLPLKQRVAYAGGPEQLEPPHAMLDCIVTEDHVHIDLCYYCRLESGYPGVPEDPASPIVWVDAATLEAGTLPRDGADVAIPPDVQALGLEAIRQAARFAATVPAR
jgi:8-oxo-dGTP pyrophosphatase MutT (NUDIX family)